MPSVVACPRCAGHIMIDTSVVARLRCPLCQGDFSTADVAATVVAAVAMATPIDAPTDSAPPVWSAPEPPSFSTDWSDAGAATIAAEALTDADQWHYPGLQPTCDETSAAESTPDADVTGTVETTLETSWCYPGFSTVASEAAKVLVSKVVTTVIRHSWSYPGLEPWLGPEIIVESTIEEELGEADLGGIEADELPAPAADEYSMAPPAARQYTAAVSPARTSMAARSRKKKNEVNPVLLMIGVFGGGVLGLVIGYCILVAIGGQRADFAHFFYK